MPKPERTRVGTPLISFQHHESIGTHCMQLVFQEAAANQDRLATDADYFQRQRPRLEGALSELRLQWLMKPGKHKQLLSQKGLLKSLAQITTAGLQQLESQLDSNKDVCQLVTWLADTLGWLCKLVRERQQAPVALSTPTDTANLLAMRDAGGPRVKVCLCTAALLDC